jgi:hypothetical protein
MKYFTKVSATLLFLLPLSMACYAAEPEQAAAPQQQPAVPAQQDPAAAKGMGAMGGMGMTEEQKNQHLKTMQESMLQMHQLSNEILAEKDPVKKQKLKDQQLELMKAHHEQMMQHRMHMKQKAMGGGE